MELLDSFLVKEKKNLQEHPCQVYLLDESHFFQVAELQEVVTSGLHNKELYFPLSPAELKNILSKQGGLGIGAFVRGNLVGFRSLYFPGYREDNLGKDIGLADPEILQVAHLEASFVHPNFQGNSLQKKLTGIVISRLVQLNRFRYLMATVMPANYPSLLDKFAHGLTIIDLKEKYDIGWRYIFYKDLAARTEFADQQAVSVATDDITKQVALLKGGYHGISYEKSPAGIMVLYKKPK